MDDFQKCWIGCNSSYFIIYSSASLSLNWKKDSWDWMASSSSMAFLMSFPGGLDLSCIQQAVKQRKEVTFSPHLYIGDFQQHRISCVKHSDSDTDPFDQIVEAINRLFISFCFWNSKGTQRLLSLSPSSTIKSSFQPGGKATSKP